MCTTAIHLSLDALPIVVDGTRLSSFWLVRLDLDYLATVLAIQHYVSIDTGLEAW